MWALKGETLSDLLDLSLNFFFILPAANAAGYHLMEAPILHPVGHPQPSPVCQLLLADPVALGGWIRVQRLCSTL